MPKPTKNLFPTISEILATPMIKPLVDNLNPGAVITTTKNVLDEIRSEMKSVATEMRMPDIAELVQRIIARLKEQEPILERPLINATGILFHPEFGAPPLAPEVLEQMLLAATRQKGARCTNPGEGANSPHYSYSYNSTVLMLKELGEVEDALILDHPIFTKQLVFSVFGREKNAILSRAEAYEGDQEGRIVEMMKLFATKPREVGSVNRTTTADYERAIHPRTGIIYLASRVYAQCRFALELEWEREEHRLEFEEESALGNPQHAHAAHSRESRTEKFSSPLVPVFAKLSAAAREEHIPLIMDLQLASFRKIDQPGLERIPILSQCCTSGVDLVLIGGGAFFGGPDCGLILGRKEWIGKLRKHPLLKSFLPSPMMLAGLHAVLALHLSKDQHVGESRIPILRILSTPAENLQNRARRLTPLIHAAKSVEEAFYTDSQVPLFHEDCPVELSSCEIHLKPRAISAQEFEKALLLCVPGIVAKIRSPHSHCGVLRTQQKTPRNPPGKESDNPHEFYRSEIPRDGTSPFGGDSDWISIDLRCISPVHDSTLVEAIESIGTAF